MCAGNTLNITAEWLKDNGWRCLGNTFNKTVNGRTYYLVYNSWCVFSRVKYMKRDAVPDAFVGDSTYTLFRKVAGISTRQALDMLTSTGKVFDIDTIVPLKDSDDVLSRYWLRENGWKVTLTGDYHKCINGVWYEMIYTDFDCDFILTKELASITTTNELENLVKEDRQ